MSANRVWCNIEVKKAATHRSVQYAASGAERFGSGDGEREASMTRQMPFEPLPASVLFGLVCSWMVAPHVVEMENAPVDASTAIVQSVAGSPDIEALIVFGVA